MSGLSLAIAFIFYAATAILVGGLAFRIKTYMQTPAPLKIPTTPAPTTTGGVVLRMFREVAFFESLFKANKWTWIFGYLFHFGMFLVLARHLRYIWPGETPMVLELIQPIGMYASFAMVAGLFGLWARRFLVDRVRYISAPSDHLMLMLIIIIGITGMLMSFVAHTDIIGVKQFFMGLLTFQLVEVPSDPLLIIHLLLVAFLMIIFPYSKLLHAPGMFFSPSRNQVDNPREQRHIVAWAKKLEE